MRLRLHNGFPSNSRALFVGMSLSSAFHRLLGRKARASLSTSSTPGDAKPDSRKKIDWDRINSPELVLQRFPSRRSQVYGTKGVVAASQPLAVEAGLEILRKGGNAADAAVATSAALNVTEPSCCGIGGDAFCLFYDAKEKTVKALNG